MSDKIDFLSFAIDTFFNILIVPQYDNLLTSVQAVILPGEWGNLLEKVKIELEW